jgi:hypothetical protein
VFKPGLVPDLAQLIKKQSFDYTYAAATVVPAGVAVGTLIASTLPAGTPAFVAWKTFPGIPSYSTAAFNFACYFDGTNLHVEAMNNTGSGIDISGASITITAILPYT